MFGVDTSELVLLAVLALIFIGPKDLPNALRVVGRFVGQVRGMARHFQTGVEAMIREAELEEMEKKWREENDRIMREYPALLEAQKAEAEPPALPEPTVTEPAAPPVEEQPGLPLDPPQDKRELP